jgi:Peptidase family M48
MICTYIYGIPVVHEPHEPLAVTKGIWPRKRIVVGDRFFRYSRREQAAILHHEVAHALNFHLEIRWLLVPVFWSDLALRVAIQQELDADRFAADHGYGVELMNVIRHSTGGDFYPSTEQRCAHLTNLLREKIHAVAA